MTKQIMFLLIGSSLVFCFSSFSLSADPGTSQTNIPSAAHMDALVKQLEKQLSPIRDGLKTPEKCSKDSGKKEICDAGEYKETFTKQVINTYLPSARVLFKEVLPKLDAKHLKDAYEAIIEVFDMRPWYYFLTSSKGFDGRFLYSINDELTVFYRFLKDYVVDTKTGKLVGKKVARGSNFTSIKDYWTGTLNVETYYRFHALIADYGFVKLYGFAMRLIPDREATKQFVSTYGRLYQIVSMVSGSRYERQYQESIKAAQRIMKLMEARTHSEEGPGNARSMAQRVM